MRNTQIYEYKNFSKTDLEGNVRLSMTFDQNKII